CVQGEIFGVGLDFW
nr:immunoglobulin heavy chain junction region [Macaca mulatta]MOX59246.1 immunoglobulin heavy chain junction region [Macaca mulatta]MOX60072.1 immunoglobulin heavy chain junction region [Macaca mulatta]MOX60675.1 immunoglobulin heavy chain junction region [Macaca mulatta]MOX62117.1 immunoglobulin heavy chain junction region [Macaca mulatta]